MSELELLRKYKAIADEVLTTISMDETQSQYIQDLALRALNLAAHEKLEEQIKDAHG
jgi:abortive infection bacteriophage resistance protein